MIRLVQTKARKCVIPKPMPDANENRRVTSRPRRRHGGGYRPRPGDRFSSVKIDAVSNLHRQG
jgi:hypothetical protein